MMRATVVLDIPGLAREHLDHMPRLAAFARAGAARDLSPMLPALAAPMQATFLTGLPAALHGAVADGWYHRDAAELVFEPGSDRLVSGERVWEAGRRRDPAFTCAKLFWSHGLYGTTDLSVSARPCRGADGEEALALDADPPGLRDELEVRLGRFPSDRFRGPGAGIESSEWIARCARHVFRTRRPALTLARLPHLDFALHRHGPSIPRVMADLLAIDEVAGRLASECAEAGARVLILSEYAFTEVRGPLHLNRLLRQAGLLRVREEPSGEVLDAGASFAFAAADHQVAHLYLRDPSAAPELKAWLERLSGVDLVLDAEAKRRWGLDHPRAGDLVAIGAADRWFSYYYWFDDDAAPAFARVPGSASKPGCDPAELLTDPAVRAPRLAASAARWRARLGLRPGPSSAPLHGEGVRGSHGRPTPGPVILSSEPGLLPEHPVAPADVRRLILDHVFRPARPERAAVAS